MSDQESKIEYRRALEDFRQARTKARLQHLWAAVTGESLDLLRFDEITTKMHATGQSSKGLKNIPVNAIVGSVNRDRDFDRNFLPLRDDDEHRWAKVKAAMTAPASAGLPPIIVYKIGEVYFVLDGNHRVSIARQMGLDFIDAYVTEIKTNVQLSPDDSPDEIILKAEYSDFLETTKIDQVIPDAEFKLTFPGQYPLLIEHIRVHRHYMGLEQQREISWEEAVLHWFHHFYQPIVDIIRKQAFLIEFPEKTETDLYLWLLDHQSYMEKEIGWSIRPEKAASDLLSKQGKNFLQTVRRKIRNVRRRNDFESNNNNSNKVIYPQQTKADREKLFADILVPISGEHGSWQAVDQAIILAKMEDADVRGLSVHVPRLMGDTKMPDEEIKRIFAEKLEQSGLRGNLVFTEGKIAEKICERAKVNDLVVIKMSHPPSTHIFARLKSGTRSIVRNSPQPLLFVRDQTSQMDNLLLAYDGSPKGKEALYISAYFASRYNKQLSVIVVDIDAERGQRRLTEANNYLGFCCVNQIFKKSTGRVSIDILKAADEIQADMILMGGYGLAPMLEMVFGSTVDGVLRGTQVPVLVSQ